MGRKVWGSTTATHSPSRPLRGKGGAGGADLARKVVNAIDNQPNNFSFAYDVELSIKDKIRTIAQKVYGAEDVDFSAEAAA